MSEQTPESTAPASVENGFGDADSEPSMEDILASIRKIISDDAEPVALDGPSASPIQNPAEALLPTVSPTETAVEVIDSAASDDVAFDMDALLDELDMPELPDATPKTFAETVGFDESTSLENDLTIPEIEPEIMSAESEGDDMDRLMNDLMGDMVEPKAQPVPEGPVSAAVPTASTDDDMDVVKSLMADLTDAPIEAETAEEGPDTFDMDALMGDFDNFDDAPEADTIASEILSDDDDLDAMEDDIFDSILEMTLDDEVDAFDAQAETDMSVPSLSDIASAAESEAVVEPSAVVGVAAVAAAVAASVVAAQPAPEVEDEAILQETVDVQETAADVEPTPTIPEPAQPAPSEMETPMPSALRSDAILDDVTEVATMSAFAELNQVVEDKAILSERGPRIGDLVQDALKPMLKEWLDENIQGIVERAVAKEVKRIATGK